MDFVYFKIMVVFNSWLLSDGISVAMHAVSSQSIVFHRLQTTPLPSTVAENVAPSYEYKYEVSDFQTGDRKSHWENREGDRVLGGYSLYEPDGAQRTVEYSADALHGFNAVVTKKEPVKPHYIQSSNSQHDRGISTGRIQDGYDISTRHSAASVRQDLSNRGHKSEKNRTPAFNTVHTSVVDFTVNHEMGLKRSSENPNPLF